MSSQSSTICPASWILKRDEDDQFSVVKHSGKLAQTMGFYKNGNYFLRPEEAFFLLETGRAILEEPKDMMIFFSSERISYVDIMSYERLKELGFIFTFSGTNTDIYLPNSDFKKTDPGYPLGKFQTVDANESVNVEDLFFNNNATIVDVCEDAGNVILQLTKYES